MNLRSCDILVNLGDFLVAENRSSEGKESACNAKDLH